MATVKCEKGDVLKWQVEGSDEMVMKAIDKFMSMPLPEDVQEIPVSAPVVRDDGVQEETVVIYDDAGIPSIMRKFSKVTNRELFGGSDKVHPAFIIGGEEYDAIYISVYENCEINGKPYSLPYQQPWTNITNDKAAEVCFAKGEGWHLMTAMEWGLIANICARDNTMPHGNTDSGKYHADPNEHGETFGGYGKTLTGSGPSTWTHNHKPDGVHDLCGNIWEMLRGLRVRDGKLQAPLNNDAALDIDLTREGDCWMDVGDDEGYPIRFSVEDGEIHITTKENAGHDYDGSCWEDVHIDCQSEALKELGLYPGEPEAYFYVDSTDGEYFPYRGGDWSHGTTAGVFYAYLHYGRSSTGADIGFRSAYFKKH